MPTIVYCLAALAISVIIPSPWAVVFAIAAFFIGLALNDRGYLK